MSSGLRELIAGVGASGMLVGLLTVGGLGLPLSLGLAVVSYFGVRLLLPAASKPPPPPAGPSELDVAKASLERRARQFESLALRIGKWPVAHDTEVLARIVRDLGKHFDRDPENVSRSRDFLDLQLPKAVEIVERYVWLTEQPYLDPRARKELEASEKTIRLIEKAFEEQHRRLLAEDLREFTIDRRVFEELLRLDERLELAETGTRRDAGTERPEGDRT